MMIKNIIFDIGGVLVEFHPEKTIRDMGLPEEEVQAIAYGTGLSPIWAEFDRGVMSREEVIKLMLKGIPDSYKADAERFLRKEALKTVTPYDYAAEWVSGLKERGYNIYLLTNYPDWMFDYHFEHTFTLSKFVDGMVVSGKVKCIKPDARIYQEILNKYSLNPAESVFIDDRLENVVGAKAQGIHGIQFTNIEDVKSKLENLLKA